MKRERLFFFRTGRWVNLPGVGQIGPLFILTVPTNAPDNLVFAVTLHLKREEAAPRWAQVLRGLTQAVASFILAISTGISFACVSAIAFVKLGYQAGKNPCLALQRKNAPAWKQRFHLSGISRILRKTLGH